MCDVESALHGAEVGATCRCGHPLHEDTCNCGCEWDSAFCPRCGWLDCECVTPPAETEEDA